MIFVPVYAPVCWLSAATFSAEYVSLYVGKANVHNFNLPDIMLGDEVIKSIISFLQNDNDRRAFFDEACDAVENGDIKAYELIRAAGQGKAIIVDSLSFWEWAKESRNKGGKFLDVMGVNLNITYPKFTFPWATLAQLQEIRDKPLWNIGEAILYVLGRVAMPYEVSISFISNNDVAREILELIRRDYFSGGLEIHGYDSTAGNVEESLCNAKVLPEKFLEFAGKWKTVRLVNVNKFSSEDEKPMTSRERNTFSKLIAGLLDMLKYKIDNPYAIHESIAEELKKRNIDIGPETIGKKITEARDFVKNNPDIKLLNQSIKK